MGYESTEDHRFTAAEEARIEAFLDQGGRVILSGAELGYATDPDWLARVFGVSLVADDAGTDQVEGFTIGAAYPENYPDVRDGPEVIWRYATGGAERAGGAGWLWDREYRSG